LKIHGDYRRIFRFSCKKKAVPPPGNPAFNAPSGNPAIRLRRTRGFPSPDYSGFGFFMSNMVDSLFQISLVENAINRPKSPMALK
jgi:hypothetical protein